MADLPKNEPHLVACPCGCGEQVEVIGWAEVPAYEGRISDGRVELWPSAMVTIAAQFSLCAKKKGEQSDGDEAG